MVVVFDVAERAVPAAPAISATSASSGAILVVRIVLLPLSGGRFSAASAATAGTKHAASGDHLLQIERQRLLVEGRRETCSQDKCRCSHSPFRLIPRIDL